MPIPTTPPPFSAVLFGLSGCLVDFGARTLPVALQRLYPQHAHGPTRVSQAPHTALRSLLERPPLVGELQALDRALGEVAGEHAEAVPGAQALLASLRQQGVPCAWLDELPRDVSLGLSAPLPEWLVATASTHCRPWPAPDACWQALTELRVNRLDGCVLISGEPRLLQAGLNAGLWTIGLATCGSLCGQAPGDWQALASAERERLRAQATLALYRLGVHSVIDQLTELDACLADLYTRRQKGEKP